MENPLPAYLKKIGVIKSRKILEAFGAIDRVDFVPEEIREAAYIDEALPIGQGQTISQPYTVAFMLELLDPRPGEKIMDIGAGSGWQTSLLAYVVSQQGENQKSKIKNQNSGRVYAIERLHYLCDFGKKNIEKYNFIKKGIVKHYCRDASEGLPDQAPFDKIIAAANIDDLEILKVWGEQLKIGGRIVAPVGNSLWLWIKQKDGNFQKKEFPGFTFVPFIHPVRNQKPSVSAELKSIQISNGVYAVIGVLFLLGIFYYLFFSSPRGESPEKERKIFQIEKGENLSQISQNLKNEGFVKNSFVFKTFFSLMAGENKAKAGDYLFEKPLSVWEIKNRLAEGIFNVMPVKATILEGWSTRQIGEYFEKTGFFSSEDWLKLAEKEEGYLFPDTYFFSPDIKPDAAIKIMRENFDKKVGSDLKQAIADQGKNLSEIIIMASIIEKEMGSDGDGRIISGILWKRFEAKMGLQADATLTYLTGKPSLKLTEKDLAIDSPYNTYKYRGLPVGPISNPGLGAIKAAIFPEKSPYWYYLHDLKGQPHYARDFEEHKQNKFKYLK